MSQLSENEIMYLGEKFFLKWNGTMGWERSGPVKIDF
jgi:hypothetical protein